MGTPDTKPKCGLTVSRFAKVWQLYRIYRTVTKDWLLRVTPSAVGLSLATARGSRRKGSVAGARAGATGGDGYASRETARLTRDVGSNKFFLLSRSMNPWSQSLVVFELSLFGLILVLPQADLPDFTSHRGSALVCAKSKLSCAPAPVAVTNVVQPQRPRYIVEVQIWHVPVLVRSTPRSLLSMLCSRRC